MSTKRILSLVLALVMVLGTFGTVFAQETGSEKIDWLVKQGIVQGTSQGLELDKTVDRATLARLVAVALNEEAAAESLKLVPSGFVDMNTAHWANGYAALANGRGYMVGNAKREFMPSKATTYAEVLSVLVRVSLGRDLTDVEKAGAITWYAPYVAKAAELGITTGVSIANVGADAVRKDVLEMLYNVLTSKSHGRYDVYKAIVLENSRVSKLSSDEIVVEVIEKVKTAQYVEESRKEGRGSQLTLKIDPEVIDNKLATPENLLGRVADFTVTKDGKVVEVKIDESYKIISGYFTAERNNMRVGSSTRYAVNLPERYYADRDRERYDETIFRTYYNNRSYSYEDFYQGKAEDSASRKESFGVEYARVTVKDGKVLLINAFGFEDIAPVKEVNKDGEVVIVYNDARDGATKRYEISASANLIFVNDGVLSKGNRKDIAVDNVIHEYKGGFIVKQDKAVTGKLEKVSQDKYNDVYVHVDGEEYYISDETLKQGVFEFETNKDFYTLKPENAHNDLRTFRGETVKLVTALDDSVQYIGSEVDLGEFVGIATRIVGKDLRVLRSDKKTYDYEANLDTVVSVAGSSTGHQGLNSIEKHSLVFVRANDKVLNKVVDFKKPAQTIKTFESVKRIETATETYKILDETEVFVINKDANGNEYVEVRKIKDVQDAYKDLKDKSGVRVNVLSEAKYFKESSRYDKERAGSETIAVALVFSDIKIPTDTTRIYAEFRGYNDRQGKELDIRTADGESRTVKLSSLSLVTEKLESGDILRLEETKGDDKQIIDLKVEIRVDKDNKNYVTYKVKSANRYNEIELEDGPTITKDRATKIFGNEPVKGDVIAFAEYEKGHDDYEEDYAIVIKNFGPRGTVKNGGPKVDDDTKGLVTYINKTTGAKIEIDGELYDMDENTRLLEDGKTIAVGGKDIATKLNENDVVKDVEVKNGVVVKMTLVEKASDKEAEEEAIEKALNEDGKGVNKVNTTTAMKTALEAEALGLDIEKLNALVDGRESAALQDLIDNKPAAGYTKDSLAAMYEEVVATRTALEDALESIGSELEDITFVTDVVSHLEGLKVQKKLSDSDIKVAVLPAMKELVEDFEALTDLQKAAVLKMFDVNKKDVSYNASLAELSGLVNAPSAAVASAKAKALVAVNAATSSVMMRNALEENAEILELEIPADKLADVAAHVFEVKSGTDYTEESLKTAIGQIVK